MFNVCVVGCGGMGSAHVSAWMKRSDARVVAVCDLDENLRNKAAATCGGKAYASLKEVPKEAGLNAVSVCTPVCFHSEVAVAAAQRGCHVLVEKPIALTLDQADAMIKAAKANNVLLSVSFQYRALPKNVKYRQLFREGAFGGPIFYRCADIREVRPKLAMHRQSMNGGPLIDMAGHFFDMMRYITGQEPVSVYALGHVFGRGKPRLASIDQADLAIDAATIEVAFHGGHTLSAFANWGMPEGHSGGGDEMFIGPSLSARPAGNGVELRRGAEVENWTTSEPSSYGPEARIDGLVKAINGEAPLEVTGQDGRVALQLSLGALESIRTGAIVRV